MRRPRLCSTNQLALCFDVSCGEDSAASPLVRDEEWRDIPNCPGYQVSDHGRVRSFYRRGSSRMHGTALVLVAQPQSMGYPFVQLRRLDAIGGRKLVGRTVHSLVMEVFVGPCPAGKIVCHEDGNFSNARLENLRYDTYLSNRKDMIRDRRLRRGVFAEFEPSIPPVAIDEQQAEEWRDVPEFRGYQVSDRGRVRSFWGRGGVVQEEPFLLAASPGSHGYPQVHLSIGEVRRRADGKRCRKQVGRTVHSLVMEAFVGPCPPGHLVCHEDGRFWNARLDNLRYDTQRSNRKDMIRDRRAARGTFAPLSVHENDSQLP